MSSAGWRCCSSGPVDHGRTVLMDPTGITVLSAIEVGLRSDQEIVRLRQLVRDQAIAQGFSLVDQTKFVTAASELARNTLIYGGGGDAQMSVLMNGTRKGLRI